MSATHLGLVTTNGPGRTIEVNDQNGITHMVPRTMPHAAALDPATHPALGTVISIMGARLALRGYSITLLAEGVAEVQYRYGNSIDNSDANAPITIDGVPLYSGRAGSALTEFYDLDTSLESISILRHPRYQTLASADLRILAAMIQLGPLDANNQPRRSGLTGTDRAEECADKIEAGTITYLAPKYVWRFRKIGGPWNAGGYTLGKVSNPPGPVPNIGESNWLYMGRQAGGWDGGVFESVHVWESSPQGDTWDADLYDD